MAKETNQVFDHDFDGIQEYDNPLPPWWLILFYITIIWGVVYIAYFHVFGMGDLSKAEYEKEMAAAEAQMQAVSEQLSSSPQPAVVLLTGAEAISAGKAVFNKPGQCVSCHGAMGEGLIGPNLTDDYWINGDGSITAIIKVVTEGVPAKGMIPWGSVLKPADINYVSQYLLTFQGTNPPNGKAPEGHKF